MHPDPLQLGPLTLEPYGLMLALAIWTAVVLGTRENARRGFMDPTSYLWVGGWTVLVGLVTSRLFYVASTPQRFIEDPLSIFATWQGGLVYYGGPIGSAAFVAWLFMIRRTGRTLRERVSREDGVRRFLQFVDIGSPPVVLAHAIGRIGCTLHGCCYGRTWDGPLALHYPEHSLGWNEGSGRYPVPPAEALFELALFAGLKWLTPRRRYDGQVFVVWIVVYAGARIVFELFRGDRIRGYLVELHTPGLARLLGFDPTDGLFLTWGQATSLALLGLVGALRLRARRRPARTPEAGSSAPSADEH